MHKRFRNNNKKSIIPVVQIVQSVQVEDGPEDPRVQLQARGGGLDGRLQGAVLRPRGAHDCNSGREQGKAFILHKLLFSSY